MSLTSIHACGAPDTGPHSADMAAPDQDPQAPPVETQHTHIDVTHMENGHVHSDHPAMVYEKQTCITHAVTEYLNVWKQIELEFYSI